MKGPRRFLFSIGMSLACLATTSQAGETSAALIAAGMPADCAQYASNVSQSEGNFNSTSPTVNGVTCYGAFQFCSATGSTAGGTFGRYAGGLSPLEFKGDPSAQVAAWQQYEQDSWAQAQQNGLTAAIGKQVCYQGQCATVTESSILKACQFGCQNGGKLSNFVNAGFDCNAPKTKDGAGTSVCKYLLSGAGQSVSCITGNSSDDSSCAVGLGYLPTTTTTDTAQNVPQIAQTDINVSAAQV